MTNGITELEAIRNAAKLYGEGLHNGDVDLLKKAFHPKGMMYGFVTKVVMITDEPHKYFITNIKYGGNAALL